MNLTQEPVTEEKEDWEWGLEQNPKFLPQYLHIALTAVGTALLVFHNNSRFSLLRESCETGNRTFIFLYLLE
jgi:hypothetical protein